MQQLLEQGKEKRSSFKLKRALRLSHSPQKRKACYRPDCSWRKYGVSWVMAVQMWNYLLLSILCRCVCSQQGGKRL